MATHLDYIEYVYKQIENVGIVEHKKMFGEYMVYVNGKPILLVCDNTVFVKMHECLQDLMSTAETGKPYSGAKMHYVLPIEDRKLVTQVIRLLEPLTPFPKPRKKKV